MISFETSKKNTKKTPKRWASEFLAESRYLLMRRTGAILFLLWQAAIWAELLAGGSCTSRPSAVWRAGSLP